MVWPEIEPRATSTPRGIDGRWAFFHWDPLPYLMMMITSFDVLIPTYLTTL
jgi:hypothetical protein